MSLSEKQLCSPGSRPCYTQLSCQHFLSLQLISTIKIRSNIHKYVNQSWWCDVVTLWFARLSECSEWTLRSKVQGSPGGCGSHSGPGPSSVFSPCSSTSSSLILIFPASNPDQRWRTLQLLWSTFLMASTSLLQLSQDSPFCKLIQIHEDLGHNIFSSFSQQEYVVVLCWVLWSAVHLLIMILLVVLSCFTVLPYVPARLLLHIVCAAVSIISALVMMKVK